MATADLLLELMFSWIEQRESCAEQLKKLADELESLRKKCNVAECVGSSVSVIGAAGLIGAGVATFFTAGAAAPALALVGGVYGGVGLTVSVTTKIIEHFSSSDTLKEAQKIEKKGNEIAEKIKKQFEQLKAEVKKKYPSADPDEVDRHVMSAFMGAVARRSGIDFSKHERFYHSKQGIRQSSMDLVAATAGLTVIVCGILAVFLLKTVGKQSKLWIAEATKHLIKETSSLGLKTALKGGVMVVGGAVGLGFALDEAIDSWKDLIKENHETEASRSMRDTADDIRKMCRTVRKQFADMRTALENARRRREREEKLLREKNTRRLCGVPVVVLFICLVFSYYRGNIMSSDPVQEESLNLMSQTDQRHVIQQCDQSEQTRCEQNKDSQQAEQTRDDEDKERDQCEINQTPAGAIRFALLNTQSMNKKIPQILELITQNNLDVFLTTETHLNDDNAETVLSRASPPNFSFHSQERKGKGGGVAIQFSKKLQGRQLHFDFITTFEFVVTVVQHDEWDQDLVIINLYFSPKYDQERFLKFLDEFQRLLDEVKKKYSSIIVTGDFNVRMYVDRRSYTDKFDDLLRDNNLKQHVEEPTHELGNTLDLVITTNVEVSGRCVRDDGISDHYTVYFNAKPKKETEENKNDEQTKRFKKTEE